MIAIVDYGVGNLFSLQCSLSALGQRSAVTGDAQQILSADRVILPGVGAFGDAADKLRARGLDQVVVEAARAGRPLLGVCLGMQLLFEEGLEFGRHPGLHLLPGQVVPLQGYIPAHLKIPQIGWNALHFAGDRHPMFRHIQNGDCVYFVHSYHAVNSPCITATCEYGAHIAAAAARDNVWGCQFHPEKSGGVGLSILRAFCEAAT